MFFLSSGGPCIIFLAINLCFVLLLSPSFHPSFPTFVFRLHSLVRLAHHLTKLLVRQCVSLLSHHHYTP